MPSTSDHTRSLVAGLAQHRVMSEDDYRVRAAGFEHAIDRAAWARSMWLIAFLLLIPVNLIMLMCMLFSPFALFCMAICLFFSIFFAYHLEQHKQRHAEFEAMFRPLDTNELRAIADAAKSTGDVALVNAIDHLFSQQHLLRASDRDLIDSIVERYRGEDAAGQFHQFLYDHMDTPPRLA